VFDLTGLKSENEQGLIEEWSHLIPLKVFAQFSRSLNFFDFLSLPLLSRWKRCDRSSIAVVGYFCLPLRQMTRLRDTNIDLKRLRTNRARPVSWPDSDSVETTALSHSLRTDYRDR